MNMKTITRTVKPTVLTPPQPAATQRPLITRTLAAPAPAPVAPKPAVLQSPQRIAAPAPITALATQKVERLTIPTHPYPIYGCTGLFDLCGDADLMSLSFQGQEPFLDWLGWEGTDICEIKRNFIEWERPAYSGGAATAGYLSDPCADGNSIDWGSCDFTLTDFGRLRRVTPTRDVTKAGLNRCVTSPRYRLDGAPITDDVEWDTRVVTEVQMGDLKRMIVNGNAATAGMFSGLEVLVNNSYYSSNGVRCAMMDSNVINWNSHTLDGGAGITWNGVAQTATEGLIAFLYAIVRRTLQRIKWSGSLSSQRLELGDIAIVAPTSLAACILDAYTCYRICDGGLYNETNLQSLEARTFRDKLNGGLYEAGQISIDNVVIPIIAYDWGLMKSATLNDMYVLTRKVGGVRTLQGQYNDLRAAAAKLPAVFDITDGGRQMSWYVQDSTCLQRSVEMQPRLLLPAPFLQTRISNVLCQSIGGNISPDSTSALYPTNSYYSAGGSFVSFG